MQRRVLPQIIGHGRVGVRVRRGAVAGEAVHAAAGRNALVRPDAVAAVGALRGVAVEVGPRHLQRVLDPLVGRVHEERRGRGGASVAAADVLDHKVGEEGGGEKGKNRS